MTERFAELPNDEPRKRRVGSDRRVSGREQFLRMLDDLQRKLRRMEERAGGERGAPGPADGRFRGLVEALPLPLAHLSALRDDTDREGRGEIIDFVCRYVNPAGLVSIGWPESEPPVGRRLWADDLVPDGDRAGRLFDRFCSVVESGRPWLAEDYRCDHRTGESGGGIRTATVDLHVGKLDDAVVLAWRSVEREDPAPGPAAGGVDDRSTMAALAHELKTPLNAMLGFCDLLRSEIVGALNEAQKEQLERIRRSCGHLTSVLDAAVSSWSDRRAERRVRREPVDLRELLREVTQLMELEAERNGLSLEVAGPDEPVEVRTDAGKVRQVLINLVSNAVKHTEGEIRVELDERDDSICFRVRDSGPGIPEEHQEEIFEPFVRLSDAGHVQEESGGRDGLGLAVCRQLAELLEGDVAVESAVGEGSTFTFRIPRA